MERLHLQAAGDIEGQRKKAARTAAHRGAGPDAKRRQLGIQCAVFEALPFPQPLHEAVLHFGRSSLGEG
jgi:hypothetical protein